MPNDFDLMVEAFGDDPAELPRLEATALDSRETFSVEGGFVDRIEAMSDAALAAIEKTYARHGVRAEDLERMCALLCDGLPHANSVAAVLAKVGAGLVPDLEAALSDPAPQVRTRAMQALGLLGRGGAAMALLSDPDRDVRAATARLLPAGEAWVRELAQGLKVEESPAARIDILNSLIRSRTTEAALAVLSCAADADGDVRAHAAHSLQNYGGFRQSGYDLASVARTALDWILVEPEPGIVANVLRHVPLLPHEPRATSALVALLDDPEHVLPRLAADGLGRAGDDVARHAAVALQRLIGRDERTEIEAYRALAALRDATAVDGFAARLPAWRVQPGERDYLTGLLQGLRQAARAVPEPTAPPGDLRPRVLDRARLPQPALSERERQMVADLHDPTAWRQVMERKPRLDRRRWWLSVLAERLPLEPDADARVAIVAACLDTKLPESEAVAAGAIDDPAVNVRTAVIMGLRWKSGAVVAPAFLRRLDIETDPNLRRMLLERDALLGDVPGAAPKVLALCQDADPRIRAVAVAQLRALKFAGEPAALALLDDPDRAVRLAAATTLEAIGSARALPRLRALLATPEETSCHPALRKAIQWIEWRAANGRPSHWN